jgi:hypothetical protein
MELQFTSLNRNKETNVVKSISWVAFKYSEDGKIKVETRGERLLPFKSPSDPTFVLYFDITETTAMQWLKNSFEESGLRHLEEYLDALLQQKVTPTIVGGLPWEKEKSEVYTPSESVLPSRKTHFLT